MKNIVTDMGKLSSEKVESPEAQDTDTLVQAHKKYQPLEG